jgi:HlyD family secretion protein
MTIARRGRNACLIRPVPPAACGALLLVSALSAAAQTGRPDSASSVSVRAAQARCFTNTVEMTGHLMARETVEVVPEREGFKIGQILVAPLDTVAAGQALASLVPLGGGGTAATTVSAPVSGTVLRSQGAVGQPVSPRQGSLFQIAARGEIEFVAQAPLSVLGPVKVGQETALRTLDGASLAGRVRQIEPGADPANQAGVVRIALSTTPQSRVGTFARGIVTVERRCGLGVPFSALQYGADGTIVRVVDGDRIETRQVAVGLMNGAEAEIRSGLSESDLVVTRAGSFLREGDRVEPIVRP